MKDSLLPLASNFMFCLFGSCPHFQRNVTSISYRKQCSTISNQFFQYVIPADQIFYPQLFSLLSANFESQMAMFCIRKKIVSMTWLLKNGSLKKRQNTDFFFF